MLVMTMGDWCTWRYGRLGVSGVSQTKCSEPVMLLDGGMGVDEKEKFETIRGGGLACLYLNSVVW